MASPMDDFKSFGDDDVGPSDIVQQDFFSGKLQKLNFQPPTFTEPEYLQDRQKIKVLLRRLKRQARTEGVDTLICLEAFWCTPVDMILYNLVQDLNKHGRTHCRFKYRFSKNHNFKWIPTTGKQIDTGIVYCKAVGGFVKWLPGIPRSWQKSRNEHKLPENGIELIGHHRLRQQLKQSTKRKYKRKE